MRPSLRSRYLAIAIVASFALVGCAGSTEGVFGGDLYQQTCARCHGAQGEGGIGGPVGRGASSGALTDAQIGDIIRVGPGTMPGFPGFTDEQVESLIVHLRILQAQ